jgi:hypothetical protein
MLLDIALQKDLTFLNFNFFNIFYIKKLPCGVSCATFLVSSKGSTLNHVVEVAKVQQLHPKNSS